MIIHPNDNVEVDLKTGHKKAICKIKKGENVIKYGYPIGHAICDVKKGEPVHTHNLKTNLKDILDYKYMPKPNVEIIPPDNIPSFQGYIRENGDVGIRNEIWVINTVGCVNKTAEILAKLTGAQHFLHPFGCSQLGDDLNLTQKILKGLVNHPNAGGILVLGLGCENNNVAQFKKVLGEYNPNRVKFLAAQECEDEIQQGIKLINELKQYADTFKRQPVPVSTLRIGLKCGGSDGLSGITANPLVGCLSDKIIALGGTSILTEVPEMFGAESILLNRCINKTVFNKTVEMINNYKAYFIMHNQAIYENPSPGNKDGGISTLEEKSLGCVQKGGKANIVDVLDYGNILSKNGLNLLNGPGNDTIAVTNLTAVGAHLILFTTGRGTPVGSPVPTIKISTNTDLANRKPHWIDFDAGVLTGNCVSMDILCNNLFDLVLDIASGKQAKNEINGYREISIFKDGVTL